MSRVEIVHGKKVTRTLAHPDFVPVIGFEFEL
jgi:hypothetical protein